MPICCRHIFADLPCATDFVGSLRRSRLLTTRPLFADKLPSWRPGDPVANELQWKWPGQSWLGKQWRQFNDRTGREDETIGRPAAVQQAGEGLEIGNRTGFQSDQENPPPCLSKNHRHGQGRALPEGLRFIDSWIEANFERCFQVMECDDAAVLQRWVLTWRDLVEFEIVPVSPSKVVRTLFAPALEDRTS
jgi:Domain of unknown function (DUF3303)